MHASFAPQPFDRTEAGARVAHHPGCGLWTGLPAVLMSLLLAACGSAPKAPPPPAVTTVPTPPAAPGNYTTDGPLPNPPAGLADLPDPEPKVEPVRTGGPNKPYQAAGETFTPITDDRPLVQRGLASWYGRKFHGRPTASGEIYNMYGLTAAHPTLPIPSYARVRNPANGREVIVRINDRGPFSKNRIVDLSYTAALKLDILRGVSPVELERITHEAIRTGSWRRDAAVNVARNVSAVEAAAEPAEVAPGSAVRLRELWGQELMTEPPGAGRAAPVAAAATVPASLPAPTLPAAPALADAALVRVSTQPQPLPTQPLLDVAAAAPQALPQPAPEAPTAPVAQAAKPTAATPAPARRMPAATPTPEAAGDAARTAAGRGWWLQVGAFRERAGALQFQNELAQSAAWLSHLLALFDERGLHKLQLGPFPTRNEALAAAQRVKAGTSVSPLLVERR